MQSQTLPSFILPLGLIWKHVCEHEWLWKEQKTTTLMLQRTTEAEICKCKTENAHQSSSIAPPASIKAEVKTASEGSAGLGLFVCQKDICEKRAFQRWGLNPKEAEKHRNLKSTLSLRRLCFIHKQVSVPRSIRHKQTRGRWPGFCQSAPGQLWLQL